MRMTKAEKIILIIVIMAFIIGLGAYLLVVPTYQKIKPAQDRVNALRSELSELNDRLLRLSTIDDEINENRERAAELEKYFYPELTPVEANETIAAYLKDCGIEAQSISISGLNTVDLALENYEASSVSYAIKQYSSSAAEKPDTGLTDGQFADGGSIYYMEAAGLSDIKIYKVTEEELIEVEKKDFTPELKKRYAWELMRLAATEGLTCTVGVINAAFEVECEYDKWLSFLDYINGLERATMLSSVTIPVSKGVSDEFQSTSAIAKRGGYEKYTANDKVQMGVNLVLYCISPMAEPESIEAGGQTIELKEYANK